jgi:hypothetical protein
MKLLPIRNLFEVTADLRSGLRGRRMAYLTILKRAWSANFKMVWYVLLRLLGPELDLSKGFTSNKFLIGTNFIWQSLYKLCKTVHRWFIKTWLTFLVDMSSTWYFKHFKNTVGAQAWFLSQLNRGLLRPKLFSIDSSFRQFFKAGVFWSFCQGQVKNFL